MCVGFLSFCGGGAVSSSSPPAGCGVGSCWASFGVTALPFSWGTCGFPLRVMQLATLLGFHT